VDKYSSNKQKEKNDKTISNNPTGNYYISRTR